MDHSTPDDIGLCKLERDPDLWFRYNARHTAARICGRCPIQKRCAEDALRTEATDGVWAGVRLPGWHGKDLKELQGARDLLRRIIVGLEHQPQSHRDHTLAMRTVLVQQYELDRASA